MAMAQPEVQNGGGAVAEAKDVVSFAAVKPQLFVEAPKASDAIAFYKAAFGASEVGRALHQKRKADQELPLILSAQLLLAGTTIIVSDDSSAAGKPGGCILCLETEDVRGAVAKAVSAGATVEWEAEAEAFEGACCGGRVAKVKDPYGFTWHICSSPAADVDP